MIFKIVPFGLCLLFLGPCSLQALHTEVTALSSESPAASPEVLRKPFPGDEYGCKPPFEAGWVCENVWIKGQEQGSFLTVKRNGARYLVAAPHGWFDAGTDIILYNMFPNQGSEGASWSQLIAHSFRGHAPSRLKHNVNRPNSFNLDVCKDLPELEISKLVYQEYQKNLDHLAQKIRLYVEIHGQNEPGLEANIEVATERVSADEAKRIRVIMNEEMVKVGITGVQVVIEPLDIIFFNAGQNKDCGAINYVDPAPVIHAENPDVMRDSDEALIRTILFYRRVLTRVAAEIYPL